jgi:hypothetical protein
VGCERLGWRLTNKIFTADDWQGWHPM